MHELSLTQSVVEAIASRFGEARVTVVRLEIGKLSGVVVDSIRFCFDLVAEGTVVEGARLEITEPSGRCRCRGCATDFGTDDPIVLCPSCGGADVEVLAGRDLRISSVDVVRVDMVRVDPVKVDSAGEVSSACAPRVAAPTTPERG